MRAPLRRIPKRDYRVELAVQDRATWQRYIDGSKVFFNVDDKGVPDLLVLLTFLTTWRELKLRSSQAMKNRYPQEGKGARKAEHKAQGTEEGYKYAASYLLKRFALLWWFNSTTYIRQPHSHAQDEGGNRAYWESQAIKIAMEIEQMLGRMAWVFALQKLLGGEPGSGRSYTDDDIVEEEE